MYVRSECEDHGCLLLNVTRGIIWTGLRQLDGWMDVVKRNGTGPLVGREPMPQGHPVSDTKRISFPCTSEAAEGQPHILGLM